MTEPQPNVVAAQLCIEAERVADLVRGEIREPLEHERLLVDVRVAGRERAARIRRVAGRSRRVRAPGGCRFCHIRDVVRRRCESMRATPCRISPVRGSDLDVADRPAALRAVDPLDARSTARRGRSRPPADPSARRRSRKPASSNAWFHQSAAFADRRALGLGNPAVEVVDDRLDRLRDRRGRVLLRRAASASPGTSRSAR